MDCGIHLFLLLVMTEIFFQGFSCNAYLTHTYLLVPVLKIASRYFPISSFIVRPETAYLIFSKEFKTLTSVQKCYNS